ncbi:tetratricopeptide repeat protein [Streptomyces polygonati]|uniref:non-specific serine/threonine protein kinase n=1 Tax=Streptomyces polygonati TaxID=1617087 RepID=A0ABV8HK12_9ACTN
MARCNRPDCGRGVIDEQGFCAECDRRPVAEPAAAAPPADSAGRTGAAVGVANVRPDPWWGLELVGIGAVPDTAEVPAEAYEYIGEEHRFCADPACRRPVGRGHGGTPGRAAGYCPSCGAAFDFAQPRGGETIAGRYEVKRALGSGSYGTAYLVHDRNLGTDVVLKALKRQSVAKTAEEERDALVGLRHDSIVRILSYEPEGSYLVLEYVPGAPLSARADTPLEVVLAHGLQILQALDYLHARGLLHCDVKPSNIIRFKEESAVGPRDRVRLIDFGSVRTVRDTGPVAEYTEAYAPPKHRAPRPDPEHLRPTAGFDLYCLGMTLTELCRAQLRDRTAPGVDSLHLLLARATDSAVPERRFVSARQFAEQLSGVIRQVVTAVPGRRPVQRASALFGSMTEPLHGGLGAPRPFDHWLTAGPSADSFLTLSAPFAAPAPGEVAKALPAPLADPDHPPAQGAAAGALAACRISLRRGDAEAAREALAAADLPPGHWLRSWYRGLIELARGDATRATEQFTGVRRALPGELIPRLALGLCAELRGDLQVAQLHYGTVFDTAPALGAAGFGLARVHLLAGRRAEAVAVAERLAAEFRFEREARIAVVRLLTAVLPIPGSDAPAAADLDRARGWVAGLEVDAASGAGLRAEIEYAQFVVAGDRLKLSEVVREVAGQAGTERDHTALVDLANRLRPPVVWGRGRRRRRGRRAVTGAAANPRNHPSGQRRAG